MIVSTAYDVYLQKNGTSKQQKYRYVICHNTNVMLFTEPVHSVLLAFSVYTNGQKILKVSDDPEQILCFNGMKFISMLWVITGHRFSIPIQGTGIVNPADIDPVTFAA